MSSSQHPGDAGATAAVPPPARATWREWVGLLVLLLPMLVLATDLTVLFLAMPSIAADLHPGTSQMLWILHVYGFVIGGFLITMGRLGDRIGRRRLLLIGSAAFAVLAVVAANSTSPEMLIAARALLGVAGATLMPSTYSLLRNMFHDDGQRRFAIAVLLSAFSAGGAIGPLLGGVLLEFFWWGSVFLVNVPALVVLLIVGPLLLPEHASPTAHRLDLPSVGMSLGGMLAIVYGLQESAEHGIRPVYLLSLGGGLVLAWLFVRRQLRLPDPLLDLSLFRNRRFNTGVATLVPTAVGLVGAFYLFTQYLQWVLDLSPLQAGLWTAPYIVVNIAGALISPLLLRRLRMQTVLGGGLLLAAGGLLLLAAVAANGGLAGVVTGLAVAGFGHGIAMALASDMIISSAPMDRAGSAASVQEVSGELGTALGIAAGGALGLFVYRSSLADAAPAEVPPAALATAQDSVSGARAAAEELPGLGPQLVAAAQDAFTDGLQVGAGVAAVILAGAGAAALVLLRRARHPVDD